jgi:competence protein ComEA
MAEQLKQYRLYILMFALNLAVLIGVIYLLRRPEPRVITITTPAPGATPTVTQIQVQVSGAVLQPGVYTLPSGSRLSDALDNAGGARPDADLAQLNLARRLNDGEEVRVPARVITAEATTAAPTVAERMPVATRSSGKVNINTATLAELDALPGIGPTLAQRIVDYRAQNGPFKTSEDIKNVKGIGDVLFEGLKDLIRADTNH